jgi:thiol:disulfide interchange protein DsbD
MTKKIILLALPFALSLIVLACSDAEKPQTNASTTQSNQATETPVPSKDLPADVVRAEAASVELKSGGSGEATLKLKVLKGYHINGNPASKFQIATSLAVEPGEGLTPGQPVYPPSVTKKFSFSEQPIAVYEDEVMIKVPVNAASAARKGEQQLKGKVRFQACDDEVCYPPRNLEATIPVTIK